MAIHIGFVTEIAWMPRQRGGVSGLRDSFEEGETVTLESVRELVEDYCFGDGEGNSPPATEQQAAREFSQACETLWERQGWDPGTAATVAFGT